jgi:ATP-binding cassette subfamily C protein CydCD
VRLWRALAAQGPAVKRRLRGGSTLDALVGDVDRLRDLVPRVLPPPIVGLTTAVSVTLVLALLHPLTLLVMLPTLLVALVIAPLAGQRADRRAAVETLRLRSAVLRRFAALAESSAVLRVNGLDEAGLRQITELDERASRAEGRSAWAEGAANSLVTAACIAASLAMIAVSVPAVRSNDISPEVVAVLVLTPLAMIDPFVLAANALQQLPALEALLIKFRWLGDVPAEMPPHDSPGVLERVEEITLEDLSARWPGQPEPAFSGVSTGIEQGDWLTVTGPSGSGKSTLLAVLMGFLRPEAGTYRLNGLDTAPLAPERFQPCFAWCPQEAHLFDSTLRANLLLARPRGAAPDDGEMRAALAFVGLGPLLEQLPAGLDTRIGSEGAGLSGGQRQRVAIARTLLTRADVLLIDEPTAHLDRPAARSLMEDLHASLSDHLVVAVTHHPDDRWPGDRRLVLGRAPLPVPPPV